MCGIVGYTGHNSASEIIIDSLKKLEYRGYDSAGLTLHGKKLITTKKEGPIANLEEVLEKSSATMGIGHTRWATHGIPSDANAHPHMDESEKVAVVHNGTIDNYLRIREDLENEGHKFLSDSDTEVLPILLSRYYNGNLVEAMSKVLDQIEGIFTIAAIHLDNPDEIVSVSYTHLTLPTTPYV